MLKQGTCLLVPCEVVARVIYQDDPSGQIAHVETEIVGDGKVADVVCTFGQRIELRDITVTEVIYAQKAP